MWPILILNVELNNENMVREKRVRSGPGRFPTGGIRIRKSGNPGLETGYSSIFSPFQPNNRDQAGHTNAPIPDIILHQYSVSIDRGKPVWGGG